MQSTRRISYAIARSFSTKPSSAEAAATTSKVSHELQSIKSMLRVDQAGELAADAIYKGQLATLPRNSPMRATIEHMHEQEKVHLEILNTLVANNRVRPSVFYPVWYAMGYALGAGTGAMGDKAAMMCTEVVEDVIGVHYNDQLRELVKIPDNEEAKNLAQVIKVLRDEELDHLSTAMDNHAKEATLYDPLSMIIRAGCKTAIQMRSKRAFFSIQQFRWLSITRNSRIPNSYWLCVGQDKAAKKQASDRECLLAIEDFVGNAGILVFYASYDAYDKNCILDCSPPRTILSSSSGEPILSENKKLETIYSHFWKVDGRDPESGVVNYESNVLLKEAVSPRIQWASISCNGRKPWVDVLFLLDIVESRMQPRLLATLVRSQPRALSMWTRSARAATPTLSLIPKAPVTQFAFRQYSAAPAPLSIEVVQERVLNVLKDFDKVDASKLGLDSHFITDLGLDSLDQVEITIAIEEEFNIELSDRDADDILTPRAAAEKVFANKHAM
ncbi:hypothetical protein CcCBS67573_g05550 [Chytriomyces confervae]|uniref:5-demethoxyubiquinone hydroxylase, mitochondrial n=1 Tax=Chytriomyces confervae TaxID=246404 RepID=A0A507FD27_9FUNG|nr:hypothetical protein CcCBS67573_g05550 [Chytriomyces confervae]